MFIIALIFALIIAFEIYKMTIQQKSNKDKWIIVVISLIFCLLLEVQYIYKYQYTLPVVLEMIIDKIHQLISGK